MSHMLSGIFMYANEMHGVLIYANWAIVKAWPRQPSTRYHIDIICSFSIDWLVRWNRKDIDSRKLDLRLLKMHVVCSMVCSCTFISSHFYIVRSSNIQ